MMNGLIKNCAGKAVRNFGKEKEEITIEKTENGSIEESQTYAIPFINISQNCTSLPKYANG